MILCVELGRLGSVELLSFLWYHVLDKVKERATAYCLITQEIPAYSSRAIGVQVSFAFHRDKRVKSHSVLASKIK